MKEAGSLAERLRQVEMKRLELEEALEGLRQENEHLRSRVVDTENLNHELQAKLASNMVALKRARATVSAIRSSFRYRLGTRLVAWPLKARKLLDQNGGPMAKWFGNAPPKRLLADQRRDYLLLIEKTYAGSGLIAAEQLAKDKFKAPEDLSLALMRLARLVINADLAEARRLGKEAVAAAPSVSKNKWLAFLLYDAGDISEPNLLLDRLPPEMELKEAEQHKIAAIRSSRLLLANSLEIPPRAKATPYVPKDKRILYVAASSLPYHVSGYTLRTHSILKELKKERWDISCVTRPGYPADRPDAAEPAIYSLKFVDDVPYQALEGPSRREGGLDRYLLGAAEILAQYAIQEQVAVIHAASNYENAIPALIAARKLGLPFIYEVRGLWEYTAASKKHSWEATERFKLDRKLETLAAVNSDRVFTLTQALAEELVNRGVISSNIALAPNGIDIEAYQPMEWDSKLAESLGITKGNFVVGYIGSIVAYEGLDDLLDAFVQVIKSLPLARLIIVGDGDAFASLREKSRSLRLSDYVIFVGKVSPALVPHYYSLLNVVALPRKPVKVCELVSPLKPNEVMAMRVPLVVSDVAALREMVVENQTALVHQAANPISLAKSLIQLASDTASQKILTDTAYSYVISERAWSKVISIFGKNYSILDKSKCHGSKELNVKFLKNSTESSTLKLNDDIVLLGEVLRKAAKEVPYYSELKVPSSGARDEEVLACLMEFPILEKSMLKNDLSAFLVHSFNRSKLRKASSSGSTGIPLTILRDASEYQIESNFLSRALASLGLERSDRVVVLRTGYDPRQGKGISFIDSRGTAWVQLIRLDEDSLSHALEVIQALKPTFIRGVGSLVAALLIFSFKTGRPFVGLKGAAYSSDEMLHSEKEFIRNNIGIKLISLWGQTERAAMAVTSPFNNKYEVVPGYGYVELVRPDGTVVSACGEYGEIVGTSLFPRATSIIRYRTGDYGAWVEPGILGNIVGRGTGSFISSDGSKVFMPINIREAILEKVPLDVNVQFVQLKSGEIRLRVDKMRRSDMAGMEAEFFKLGEYFDLAIDWGCQLDVSPSGKRQLYVNL